jgi:hypothetical protein
MNDQDPSPVSAATLPGHPIKAGAGYDCACGACIHLREQIARWRECPVPTAFDHPDCRACQMWEDAGASWPRPCAEHYGGEADE